VLRRVAVGFLVAAVGLGVAILFYLNGHSAVVHLGEKSSVEMPMAVHLLTSATFGAAAILLLGALRGVGTSVRRWSLQRQRRRRRTAEKIGRDGRRRLWAGDFQKAGKQLARAAEKAPRDLDTQLAFSRSREEVGDLDGAQRILEAARAQHGPVPQLLSRLGNVALARSNAGAAIDSFAEAVRAQPESPRLLGELMGALAAGGRFAEAAEAARRRLALEREPARRENAKRDWLTLRYRSARAAGETRESNDDLARLISEEPGFLPPLVELASRVRASGDTRRADRLLRDGLRRTPSGVLLESFASLHTASGDPSRALGPLRDTAKRDDSVAWRLAHARMLIVAGKLDEAENLMGTLSEQVNAKNGPGVDLAPERDFVAAELAMAQGKDREAAALLLRTASGDRLPFEYACIECDRTNHQWSDSCRCGAYGTLEWSIRRSEKVGVQTAKTS
jgi:uncharacterized protein HemY